MGRDKSFTAFEAAMLACYDKGVLDKGLMDALAAPYSGQVVGAGIVDGDNLRSKDGLTVEEIAVRLAGLDCHKPTLPVDPATWTPEQEAKAIAYWKHVHEAFDGLRTGWGWIMPLDAVEVDMDWMRRCLLLTEAVEGLQSENADLKAKVTELSGDLAVMTDAKNGLAKQLDEMTAIAKGVQG